MLYDITFKKTIEATDKKQRVVTTECKQVKSSQLKRLIDTLFEQSEYSNDHILIELAYED